MHTNLSLFKGFIVNLHRARKTKNASLINISWVESSACVCMPSVRVPKDGSTDLSPSISCPTGQQSTPEMFPWILLTLLRHDLDHPMADGVSLAPLASRQSPPRGK